MFIFFLDKDWIYFNLINKGDVYVQHGQIKFIIKIIIKIMKKLLYMEVHQMV